MNAALRIYEKFLIGSMATGFAWGGVKGVTILDGSDDTPLYHIKNRTYGLAVLSCFMGAGIGTVFGGSLAITAPIIGPLYLINTMRVKK
nr:hypothetical protein K-LCC10_0432 [Kaumoebavirus]